MKRLLTLFLLFFGFSYAHCSFGVDRFLGESRGWRGRIGYGRSVICSELSYLTLSNLRIADLSLGLAGGLGPFSAGVHAIGSHSSLFGLGVGGGAYGELSLGGLGIGGSLDVKRYRHGIITFAPELYAQVQVPGLRLRGGFHAELNDSEKFTKPFVGATLSF